MKIKLTTCLSGDVTWHKPGDVIDVDEAEAKRHFVNGNAVPFEEPAAAAPVAPTVPVPADPAPDASPAKGKKAKAE